MSSGWMCVEPSPSDVDEFEARAAEAVARLARALDITMDDLLLRLPDWWLAPGPTATATQVIDRRECRQLLESEDVGRVGFVGPDGPTVLPVNYVSNDGRVIFRTSTRSPLARLDNARVCFEVDGVDHEQHTGWSVLVSGSAKIVVNTRGVLRCSHPETWAGGDRDVIVVIKADRITGRRVGPNVAAA